MKKMISLVLVFCLLPVIALSEVDVSSLSYNQLFQLRKEIEKEIMSRPEFKSVKVPTGEWIIGEDIPEGYYSVTAIEAFTIIEAAPDGSQLDDFYHILQADESVGKVFFRAGSIFKTSSPVILATPKGLGF